MLANPTHDFLRATNLREGKNEKRLIFRQIPNLRDEQRNKINQYLRAAFDFFLKH